MDWNPDHPELGMEGLILLVNGPEEGRDQGGVTRFEILQAWHDDAEILLGDSARGDPSCRGWGRSETRP